MSRCFFSRAHWFSQQQCIRLLNIWFHSNKHIVMHCETNKEIAIKFHFERIIDNVMAMEIPHKIDLINFSPWNNNKQFQNRWPAHHPWLIGAQCNFCAQSKHNWARLKERLCMCIRILKLPRLEKAWDNMPHYYHHYQSISVCVCLCVCRNEHIILFGKETLVNVRKSEPS